MMFFTATMLAAIAAAASAEHLRGSMAALPAALLGAGPAGTYEGSETVLDQKINAKVVLTSDNAMDLSISGVVDINCSGEAYSFDGASGAITLNDVGTEGDCVHDALAKSGATLDGITYVAESDRIDVTVMYELLTLTMELDHVDAGMVSSVENLGLVAPISDLYEKYFFRFLEATPSGTYTGETKVVGQKVAGTVTVVTDTSMDVTVAGPVSIDCKGEAFTYDGKGGVTLDNADKDGDCIHEALDKYHASIMEISYDPASDSVKVTIKAGIIKVDLTLNHQGADLYMAAMSA